jgi:hypothetical protein
MMLYGTISTLLDDVSVVLLGTFGSSCGSGDDDAVAIIAIINNTVQTVISDSCVTEYGLSSIFGLDKISTERSR